LDAEPTMSHVTELLNIPSKKESFSKFVPEKNEENENGMVCLLLLKWQAAFMLAHTLSSQQLAGTLVGQSEHYERFLLVERFLAPPVFEVAQSK
jgi:hypothetical protein